MSNTGNEDDKAKVPIETDNFICPTCGGVLKYDIKKEKFLCTSCGFEGTIETVTEHIKEYDFEDYAQREANETEVFEGLAGASCHNCGAEIVFEEFQTSTICPMCGSGQIATVKQKCGITPEGIIPFKIDNQDAGVMFLNWVKSRWFAPNDFKFSFQTAKLIGNYIPFWTYDANVFATYTGQGGIDREETDSDGKKRTVTDWYFTSGTVEQDFDDIQICASKKMGEQLINQVLPYDTINGLKPYSSAYLSGYTAELYSVKANEGFVDAKRIMVNRMEQLARNQILRHYHKANLFSVNSKFLNVTYKHVLLPVWSAVYSYNGKMYKYIINGETGKVSGQRPYSAIKFIILGLVTALVVSVVAFAVINNNKKSTAEKNRAEAVRIYQESDLFAEEYIIDEVTVL